MALGGLVCRAGVGPSLTVGLFVTHGLYTGGTPASSSGSSVRGIVCRSGISPNSTRGLVVTHGLFVDSGSGPPPTSTAGFRSLGAYWVGGACAVTTTPPPPSGRVILGLSMVIAGLTELYGLTPDLAKGLVEDDYGNIPNRR